MAQNNKSPNLFVLFIIVSYIARFSGYVGFNLKTFTITILLYIFLITVYNAAESIFDYIIYKLYKDKK